MLTAKVLTAPGIAKMKKPSGSLPHEVPDASAPGLYVVVYPSGKKSWALRYRRPDGRPNKLVLGTFNPARDEKSDPDPVVGGHLTLAAARRLAGILKHQIAIGKDPAAIHKAAREAVALSAADTFASAARDFHRAVCREEGQALARAGQDARSPRRKWCSRANRKGVGGALAR